ncbi:MAG: serine--tRNA ligase, partial [Pseudomonadota bacterium]
QHARNAASKAIGAAKRAGDDAEFDRLSAEVTAAKERMKRLEEIDREAGAAEADALVTLPNAPAADTPDGEDETQNVELRRWGTPAEFGFAVRDHVAIGEALGLMDFEAAAALSGARFVILKGALARLERALAAFMLDVHTGEFGYEEIWTPALVRAPALFGTGQLPKFAEDLFATSEDLWLIPTAEVTLTNLAADRIFAAQDLPLRMTAWTPCFRAEAGAAGRDTRGMLRQHQFGKVELVSVVRPDQSAAELDRMAGCAEAILQRLELPYRAMRLCAGDMGFSAEATIDFEVWLPGQDAYREVSSCSNCGPFQARRMKARFRAEEGASPEPVHTLNGSGLATGRTLIALLENHQQADGGVAIPAALRPYLGGAARITADGALADD